MADITPKSARLPQVPLSEALPLARALDALAAPSSPARIAQNLGVSPAGGAFRAKFASTRYYGLIEKQGDVYALSERGAAAIGADADAALQAQREAVMGTSFGPVMVKLMGREPNEPTLAARLEDDYSVPSGSSAGLANTLVRAATEASLIADGRFDVAAIEGASHAVRAPSANGSSAERTRPARPRPEGQGAATSQREREKPKETPARPKAEVVQPPFAPSLQIVVKVDASTLTPQQIAELVRALQAPPPESESQERSTL